MTNTQKTIFISFVWLSGCFIGVNYDALDGLSRMLVIGITIFVIVVFAAAMEHKQ